MKKQAIGDKPTLEQLKGELERTKHQAEYRSALRSTVSTLIVAAAAAVLVAVVLLPVLQIYGGSMAPTLREGDYVVAVHQKKNLQRGDLVAYYFGNKLLVKRVVGLPGEMVNMDKKGQVFINEEPLTEPYLTEKSLGETDVEFPVEVPQEKYFVLGDQRASSLDSRNEAMGFVAEDQVVGKVVFRIWPLSRIGRIGVSD